MKSISSEELDLLKEHLMQKPFKYEEVFNEVLDHYATAYEKSTADIEIVLSELDQHFTYRKVDEINSRYLNDLKKHLRKSHWTIFLGNFRWPQLMYTVISGFVLLLAGPLLVDQKWLAISLFALFGVSPALIGVYLYFYWLVRKIRGITNLKNAHAELFGMAFGFSAIYMQLPNLSRMFMDDSFRLLQYHPMLTSGLLFLGMILFITSMIMIFSKIKPSVI